MGTGMQAGWYAGDHLHSQAPLWILHVAIEIYRVQRKEHALEEWQGRCSARVG